jgi:hypothetical protein
MGYWRGRMSDENSLEVDGFCCPKCGWREKFRVTAVSTFDLVFDGTDGHGDVTWDQGSPCMCGNCSHLGSVMDFSTGERSGEPYTLGEVRGVLDNHSMDVYHRDLMEWMMMKLEGGGDV